MREVQVCPKCKAIFMNRLRGLCRRCGQGIAHKREFWGEDTVWQGKMKGKPSTIHYDEIIPLDK